jgi:hypothetical protein
MSITAAELLVTARVAQPYHHGNHLSDTQMTHLAGELGGGMMDGTPTAQPDAEQIEAVGSYKALRNAIGWLTFGLPWAVFLGFWVISAHHQFSCLMPVGDKLPDSLSGYYYSDMRDVFVGAMCSAGVFLFFYRGADSNQRRLTNLAGLCAVLIALFPTTRPALAASNCGPVIPAGMQSAPSWSAWVHAGSLVVLMTSIAAVILLWRSKESKHRSRNWYLVCVILMFAAGALALIQEFFFDKQAHSLAPWLLYAEVMAFLAFGVAWFVNGAPIRQLLTAAGNGLKTVTTSLARAIPQRPSPQPAAASAGSDGVEKQV